MITVHHLNHSRSQRVLWLLEELELPYEIQYYERDPVTRLAPPALRAVHPLGKSPVLVDDGVTIAETGAIVEYLVEKSGGKLRPEAGTPDRLRWTYWMHFAEGSLMPQTPPRSRAVDHAGPGAGAAAGGREVGCGSRAASLCRAEPEDDVRLHRAGAVDAALVRGRGILRGRRDDELSARSRRRAGRGLRGPAEGRGLRRTHPRPPGLPQGAGARRTLRLRAARGVIGRAGASRWAFERPESENPAKGPGTACAGFGIALACGSCGGGARRRRPMDLILSVIERRTP